MNSTVPYSANITNVSNDIVSSPNLDSADENAKRRALLFIRHFALWKELPADTEWYEVEVKYSDLEKIRVFPRAQWRNFAPQDFLDSRSGGTDDASARKRIRAPFQSKIANIGARLLQQDDDLGSVLLIGINENEPLTVLDGNHRLVASMLTSPRRTERLRFLCGFSPRMTECCWYETNFATLFGMEKMF